MPTVNFHIPDIVILNRTIAQVLKYKDHAQSGFSKRSKDPLVNGPSQNNATLKLTDCQWQIDSQHVNITEWHTTIIYARFSPAFILFQFLLRATPSLNR